MAGIILGSGSGRSVASALDEAVKEANRELENYEGCIRKVISEIASLPFGVYVYITVVVSGEEMCEKEVLGVNTKALNKRKAIKKALELINPVRGEIADLCMHTSSLPTGVYATVIVGVNRKKFKKAGNRRERRERIRRILEILGNDTSPLNLSGLAKHFNVSRATIYRDLQELAEEKMLKAES